jgi:SAM-dependent methyltransferase
MPGLEDAYSDLKTHGFVTMTEVWEDDYFPVDDRNKTQPEPCRDCALQGPCPGQYNAYYSEYGCDELRPVTGVRSNSFNYAEARSLVWPTGGRCPILDTGVTPYDTGRSIFVRSGERMRLFKTGTRDFSDSEIESTKRALEQVYVDISAKAAPDDFASDLRKLRVVEECRTCPAYDTCARCYEVLEEDVFTRDDADIRAMVGELRGEVLDVGCGDGRYGDVLEPLVREGAVRYRGVEPHAASAARLRERWDWAEIDEAPIEALELKPNSFDHILVLRSYNHLENPAAVLRNLVAALRPTGTLLIADNVAFALLRSSSQIERAEQGPAEFEHFRNADAEHAARSVADLPLDLLRRADVGPETSNQWYLHYRRRHEAA